MVTYNRNIKSIDFLIPKDCQLFYAGPETKRAITPPSFISFRFVQNLKSFLVISKVYQLEWKSCSGNCISKRCQLHLNIKETDTFESFLTKQKFKMNQHLNFNGKCLIYLLSCKYCGLQNVGSTTDKFCFCQNDYKEKDRKTLRGQKHGQSKNFENFEILMSAVIFLARNVKYYI